MGVVLHWGGRGGGSNDQIISRGGGARWDIHLKIKP